MVRCPWNVLRVIDIRLTSKPVLKNSVTCWSFFYYFNKTVRLLWLHIVSLFVSLILLWTLVFVSEEPIALFMVLRNSFFRDEWNCNSTIIVSLFHCQCSLQLFGSVYNKFLRPFLSMSLLQIVCYWICITAWVQAMRFACYPTGADKGAISW